MKNCLKKSAERFTNLHLMEMVFSINTTQSAEGTGSPAMRFFGRALRTNLPNSIGPEIRSQDLIRKRIERHDARITKKNKRNKILYNVGDRVRLQNVKDKSWELIGTIERRRTADDGKILSYDIMTDKGYLTSRHRRYLKYLNKAHDNKNNDEVNNGDEINSDKIPDTVVEQCKRRSSRLKGVAASKGRAATAVVKSVKMGCEISSERPVEAEVKLQITGSKIEVKRFVTTTTDSCQDNCDVCVEAEAKAKLAKAEARRIRRRREYRARRKQRQRAEKSARRELQGRSVNNQMAGSTGSSLGGSIEGNSDAMGSSHGGLTEGNSDEAQSSVTNYTSRRNLPQNIIEIITILESSESEEDEMVKITRKLREYN